MTAGRERGAVEHHEKDLLGLIDEVGHERISRQQFVHRALGLGLAASTVGVLLSACGSKHGARSASPTASERIGPTTKPKRVYFYDWWQYVTPGVARDFERKTGIEVVETYFDEGEALISKLKAGAAGYDVIVPSDYEVSLMIEADLLQPLAMSYLPNFKYCDAQFREPPYDDPADQGGLRYSVPYLWGATGYAVRTDKTDVVALGAWASLWEEKYKGQIDMLNDEREDLGAALKVLGFSYNTTDRGQLDQATDKLIEQKPLVRRYGSQSMARAIADGLPITMCWNDDATAAIAKLGGDAEAQSLVKFLVPREGFAWWADCVVIPNGFHNKYAAHLFIDYLLDPEVMGRRSSFTQLLPPGLGAARPYTDPSVYLTAPTFEDMKRAEVILDLGEFGHEYTDAWVKVKVA
jgi:spermidine/putrescine transport system substrate-binding protein